MSEELFPCTCCGQCCRRINKVVENLKELSVQYPELNIDTDFPYSWSDSGVCEMLDSDNRCKCYESRPMVCDSFKVYEKIKKLGIKKEDFIKASVFSCKYLQGMPIKCTKDTWKIKRK